MIGAGSKILRTNKIGNNVKIGAGSVVLESTDDNVTVVGTPNSRIIKNIKC